MNKNPLDSWEVWAWVFPAGFNFSHAQSARLEEDEGDPDALNKDLHDDGGYPLFIDAQFVVLNECNHPVNIPNIQVSKSSVSPPLDGPILVGQCRFTGPGPADTGTQLGVYLDSANPDLMVAPGWNVSKWSQEYNNGRTITIPAHTTHNFNIKFISLHHTYTFQIVFSEVEQKPGAKQRNQTFGDHGQPFRVTALLPGVLKHQKPGDHPYARYPRLYVLGGASPWQDGSQQREYPSKWAICPRAYGGSHHKHQASRGTNYPAASGADMGLSFATVLSHRDWASFTETGHLSHRTVTAAVGR